MTYNSQLQQLRISAYGRRVQEMVQQAIDLPTREERNLCAQTIIKVMASIKAEEKGEPDFEKKLWDHLAYIADYKLDIDYPVEINRQDNTSAERTTLPYRKNNIHQRQYGALLEESLRQCAEMPEGPLRDQRLGMIANQMKRDLFLWNPGSMSDHKVMADIERLSDNRLQLPANFRFANPADKQVQGKNMLFSMQRPNKKKKK